MMLFVRLKTNTVTNTIMIELLASVVSRDTELIKMENVSMLMNIAHTLIKQESVSTVTDFTS